MRGAAKACSHTIIAARRFLGFLDTCDDTTATTEITRK
jgi:hypothetical protein